MKILVLLIIILILILLKQKEYFNNKSDIYINFMLPDYPLGNILSMYMYFLTISFIEGKNMNIVNYNYNNNKFKLVQLLLPQKIKITRPCPQYLKDEYTKLKKYLNVNFWEHKKIVKYIYPLLKENIIYKKNRKYIKDCIIHFRCSDVPFVKHPQYHLLKFNWFKKAMNICLKKTNIKKITILNCNKHFSKDQNNKCLEWTQLLGEYLKNEFNIGYEISCGSLEDDMHYMLNSKCLISSSGSLSFCLGILTNNIFVYPSNSNDDEIDKCEVVSIRKNSFCLEKEFIKHYEVDDYNNMNNNLFYI